MLSVTGPFEISGLGEPTCVGLEPDVQTQAGNLAGRSSRPVQFLETETDTDQLNILIQPVFAACALRPVSLDEITEFVDPSWATWNRFRLAVVFSLSVATLLYSSDPK